ncbi:TPA: restriction endonuclease subunit S [Photobacterium damselae]
MVPNGWEKYPLSDLLKSSNQGINTTTEKVEYSESGIPAIRSNNVSEGRFDLSDKKFVTEEEYSRFSKKFKPEFGDILYCNIGSNLGSACVNFEKHPFLITWNVFRAVPNQNVLLPQFGALLLNWNRRDLRRFATESTMPFISSKELLKYKFTIPPLPEQHKIAQILSTWDRGIATTEKLINTSKQQKKALMQLLLTGKKRLVDPETGKAFEGEWEEVKLKAITQFIKDGTHGTHKRYDKGVPMLSAANITKNHKVNFEGAPNISHDDYNKIHSKYEINEGDILLTVVGTLGRVALVPKAMKFTLQRSVAIIRTSNKASNQFLMQVFSSKEFNNLLMSKSNSTAQAGVYLGELAKIKLLLPSLIEQQKIASVLTAADKDIELLEAKLAHLKQEKKALMQQLLTGKRRVNIAEIKVATEETLEVEVA